MISQSTTLEIFQKLREDEENRSCFNCNDIDITYASVNLGILLCERCASEHRQLGINISCIKSLKEPWTARHLKLMTAGGNSSLKIFFAMYSIPSNSPDDYKFKTIACEYYREMLKMKAEGDSIMMVTPTEEEGVLLMEEYRPQEKIFKRSESAKVDTENPEYLKVLGAIKESQAFSSIKGFTTDALGMFSQGLKWGAEKGKEGIE